MNWNPNAPTVLGLEATPRTDISDGYSGDVTSPTQSVTMDVPSNVTETVTQIAAYLRPTSSNVTAALLEMLIKGQEDGANDATAMYQPNGSTATNCENQSGGTTNLYQSIDEVSPDNSDWVRGQSGGGTLNLEFNTSGVLTGKRIKGVKLHVRADLTFPFTTGSFGVSLDGSTWLANSQYVTTSPTTYVIDLGEINPQSGQPWTLAQLQALDTGTPRVTLTFNAYFANVRVYWVALQVDYCDENRLCRNLVTFGGAGQAGINQRVLYTPQKVDGTSNLAKTGTDMTFVARQPRYGLAVPQPATFSVVTITNSVEYPPTIPTMYFNPVLNTDGTFTSRGSVSPRTRTTLLEMIVSGTYSADSQVYFHTTSAGEFSRIWFSQYEQEFTMPSTFQCAGVRLWGRYLVFDNGAVPSLTVNLKRRSTGALQATGVLTKAIYDAALASDPGYADQPLQVIWTGGAATLTSGVQYYVEVIPDTTDSLWYLPLFTITVSSAAEAQTWGGTTDSASRNGSTSQIGDFPWVLLTAINSPTGLSVEALVTGLPSAVGDVRPDPTGECVMSGMPYNFVSWTETVLEGAFGYYEVQRMDTFTDWQTVLYSMSEQNAQFYDFEARINDSSCYRVRVFNTSGISSPWTAAVCSGVLPAGGVGYTFTSNHSTGSGVIYSDLYSGEALRDYASDEANELVTMKLSGRDFVVAFQPCERRGVSFSRELLINALRTPTVRGVHGFDSLRDLAKMGLPYVCVRDESGDRFFAAITVPDFRIRQPKDWMKATVGIVEVTDVATPVTVVTV